MKEILFTLFFLAILNWYFNIRNKNKCVLITSKCETSDITCEIKTEKDFDNISSD